MIPADTSITNLVGSAAKLSQSTATSLSFTGSQAGHMNCRAVWALYSSDSRVKSTPMCSVWGPSNDPSAAIDVAPAVPVSLTPATNTEADASLTARMVSDPVAVGVNARSEAVRVIGAGLPFLLPPVTISLSRR